MKLSDFFSSAQMNNTPARVQKPHAEPMGAQTAQAGRQLQSLSPGQTIQGEVVARSGSEVQIKVADDVVLSARVDQNVQLEVGKTMTFEVRNNGKALTLSPLFANTAMDANVLKALNMASLPINDSTVELTGLMMKAGLAIDRNSLQQIFREMNAFQGAGLSDIVDLHKLGLAVNRENLTQIASYKNLTHQLVDGMKTVLDALPETMQEMVREGDIEGAARMFQELLKLVGELPEGEGPDGQQPQSGTLSDEAVQLGQEAQTEHVPQQGQEALREQELQQGRELPQGQGEGPGQSGTASAGGATPGEAALYEEGEVSEEAVTDPSAARVPDGALPGADGKIILSMAEGKGSAAVDGGKLPEGISAGAQVLPGEEAGEALPGRDAVKEGGTSVTQNLLRMVREAGGGEERYNGLLQRFEAAERRGDTAEQANILQRLMQQGAADKNQTLLHKIISNRDVQKFLREGLSKLWTIKPEQVADRGKVDELYQRLDRQLKGLNHMLEQGGRTESPAFKAVNNMTQNLDFLQQLNHAYTYVQLPLRLHQGNANGDLYVYTNKRNLAARDGQISALLHLDMEHLGPVDVYVAMQAEKVSTRFYVQDDEMLDFLEAHMDLLTERLRRRGYNCSFAMQVRDRNEEPESGLNGLMAQEKGRPIVQYAFDMRA